MLLTTEVLAHTSRRGRCSSHRTTRTPYPNRHRAIASPASPPCTPNHNPRTQPTHARITHTAGSQCLMMHATRAGEPNGTKRTEVTAGLAHPNPAHTRPHRLIPTPAHLHRSFACSPRRRYANRGATCGTSPTARQKLPPCPPRPPPPGLMVCWYAPPPPLSGMPIWPPQLPAIQPWSLGMPW